MVSMINASVFEIMKTTTSFFLFFRHVPVSVVNLSDCLGGGETTPHILREEMDANLYEEGYGCRHNNFLFSQQD